MKSFSEFLTEKWIRLPNYLKGGKLKSFVHNQDFGSHLVQTSFFSQNEMNKNPKAKKKYDVHFSVMDNNPPVVDGVQTFTQTYKKKEQLDPKFQMAILSHVRDKIRQFHRVVKPDKLTFSVAKDDPDYAAKRKVWSKFRRSLK